MLHEFITVNRDTIIGRCRARVALRSMPPPTGAEIDHGVPMFLDQLGHSLRLGLMSGSDIGASARHHAHDLRASGFTVSQVVHGYGDICQAITALAIETNAPVSTNDFQMLNLCLDNAIAGAVTEYSREGNQSTLDEETARASERLGFFVHELRNLLNAAIISFDVLRTGEVGVGGSTGNVLHRSLMGLRALVGRSLSEISLTQDVQHFERIGVSGFIEEIAQTARLEADTKGVALEVVTVDDSLMVEADRRVLASVVSNLLQNAIKFTRPATTVTVYARGIPDRVLIEIHDACGGLPPGNTDDLFSPFQQQGTDRTGVGLGLAFCRWGVEANHGRIVARDLPGKGCIFTIELPRRQRA